MAGRQIDRPPLPIRADGDEHESQTRRSIEQFMESAAGMVADVDEDVATNTADIATNVTNIATNVTDIGTNDGRLDTLEAAVDAVGGPHVMPAAGRWYRHCAEASGSSAGAATTEDRMYLIPFMPNEDVTMTELGFRVTSAGAGSSTARVGLYSDSGRMVPNAVLAESGDIAVDSTGVKTATGFSVSLSAGSIYWFAVATQGGTPTLRSMTSGQFLPLGHSDATNALFDAATYAYVTLGASWTALPDPAGAITAWGTGQHPIVVMKV